MYHRRARLYTVGDRAFPAAEARDAEVRVFSLTLRISARGIATGVYGVYIPP